MPGNRKSIRLKDYDYTQEAAYYVTVCTQNRECLFGVVRNGEMVLNDAGEVVDKWWCELPLKYPMVEIDEYKIMPNHLHGIIMIVGNNENNNVGAGEPRPDNDRQNTHGYDDKGHGNRAPTLGQIIAYFKYGSTN